MFSLHGRGFKANGRISRETQAEGRPLGDGGQLAEGGCVNVSESQSSHFLDLVLKGMNRDQQKLKMQDLWFIIHGFNRLPK